VQFLEQLLALAPKAHRRQEQGHPVVHPYLNAAYALLSRNYIKTFGGDAFTNGWKKTEAGLRPRSAAAKFMFEIMRLVDPDRPRPAEELRTLMGKIIKSEPGLNVGVAGHGARLARPISENSAGPRSRKPSPQISEM
jgi:hypothetical protein